MSLYVTGDFDNDQLQRFAQLSAHSFSFPVEMWDTWCDRIGRENHRLILDGPEVVGGLGFYRVGQWFGGKELSMAGIAAVSVAPQRRGTGASSILLTETLRELHRSGFALSTLFASTQPPYRRVGFEHAGHFCEFEIGCHSIGTMNNKLELVPAQPEHDSILVQLANERGKSTNGNLARSPGLWERVFHPREYDTSATAYLVKSASGYEGYVIYLQTGGPFAESPHLAVRDIMFKSREAAESIWSFLAGHRSIVKTVRWRGPYTDPFLTFTAEDNARVTNRSRWMTRVVNVTQALSGRGYPNGFNGQLHLEIEDPLIPENQGRFLMDVQNGEGRIEPGGDGRLRLNVSVLSPLISSLHSASLLADMGMIHGDQESIPTADRLFLGSEPWMPDTF